MAIEEMRAESAHVNALNAIECLIDDDGGWAGGGASRRTSGGEATMRGHFDDAVRAVLNIHQTRAAYTEARDTAVEASRVETAALEAYTEAVAEVERAYQADLANVAKSLYRISKI